MSMGHAASEGDIEGDPDALEDNEEESVGVVLEYYDPMTSYELSELTHKEPPWRLGSRT